MSDERNALRRADAAARALAQREFVRPLVLEAGAGTGKTATLVARVVAWCLDPGWEKASDALSAQAELHDARIAARVLGRVVAITFTEAAAAEMATRVEAALAALEEGRLVLGIDADALPPAPARAARAAALRGALDHLVVHTLHAYARRLLDARPYEARVHPQLEVDADERVQQSLVREVVMRALRSAYSSGGDALALGAGGVGPLELEAELVALLKAGVSSRDLGPELCGSERIRALLARALADLDTFAAASGDRLAGLTGRNARAVETMDAIARTRSILCDGLAGDEPPHALLERARALWDEATLKRLGLWAKADFNVGETRAVGELADATSDAAKRLRPRIEQLRGFDPEALERARRVLAPLLAAVEESLRARGVASFAALLSGAADLLERRPDVAALLRRGIDQLLVDEFQDTDPLQCAIVAALALDGPPAERPGLFIVGDPKQSIYGWRSADLAAYEAFVARVEAEGGQIERLSVNHRSVPAVLDEVERAIAPVMRREPGLQPRFEPLLPSETNAELDGPRDARIAPVEHWIAVPWDADSADFEVRRAGDANELEARALAADLRSLHDERGVAWRDVGVLFRSRGDWDVYLGALREADVPFAVEGDRSYFRRREIIDAAAFVRCVLDRNDQVALVAFLRSTGVGVPDAAWIPLWARDFPERVARLGGEADEGLLAALRRDVLDVATQLPADVPGLERVRGWEQNLVAALQALAALRHSFERDPGDLFVETLRDSLLFEATEAARFLGSWRVANLDRFFRDLSRDLAAATPTEEVLRRLANAVAEEEPMEEEPPHEAGLDAVQILTLHGAKGLDFAHVYLMQLHKGTGRPNTPQIDAKRVDGVLELRLLGLPTPGFDRAQTHRARVEEAERVRLLYVGMTRARERLVLSSTWPGSLGRSTSGNLFQGLGDQRRELPDCRDVAARARAAGCVHADLAGARFVVLGLREAPTPERRRTGPETELAAPEDLDAATRRHARCVREAQARMARPLGGRASGTEREADREERAARRSEGRPAPRAARRDAEIARLTGIAVHRVFERLDLGAPVAAGLDVKREELAAWLHAEAEPELARAAALAARALLDRLADGSLVARLETLRGHVVARELPVLVPAAAGDAALAFVAGAVDLVYRDPQTQEWVVVDYKTDVVPTGEPLEVHAQSYAGQAAVYRRALREGLGLDRAPRFELWFLASDRCVTLAEPEGEAPAQLSLTLAPSGE